MDNEGNFKPITIETSITQCSVCGVTIRDKNKLRLCRFFVVPGDGAALLVMPDTKMLGILNEILHNRTKKCISEINEKNTEEKYCTNKNSNTNPMVSIKINTKCNTLLQDQKRKLI